MSVTMGWWWWVWCDTVQSVIASDMGENVHARGWDGDVDAADSG